MDFRWRALLQKDDAAYNSRVYEDAKATASDLESYQRALDLERLAYIAAQKRQSERLMRRGRYGGLSGREVDQEAAIRDGVRFADRYGATGRGIGAQYASGLANASAWAASEPESRSVFMQAMLAPEHALMHTMEAFSSDGDTPRPASEVASRLAMAVPASLFPEVGYPVQPAYDRMYRELGPVKGAFVDFVAMPGLDVVGNPLVRGVDRMRYGAGARTYLEDKSGVAIRRLLNSPAASAPRLQYAQ